MKGAIILLAIIGLVTASPLAKQQQSKARKFVRAPTNLASGSAIDIECTAAGYTLRIEPIADADFQRADLAVGAGNDLAVNGSPDLGCLDETTPAEDGFLTFNQRSYATTGACGGQMVTAGQDVTYTVSVSVAEEIAVADDDAPVNDVLYSNVEVSCTFRLDDPDAANGNAGAETIAVGAEGDATIPFSLSPVNVRANRFAFTLAPGEGAVFPLGFNYNLVSCRSRRSDNPENGDEYVFIPATAACGRGVDIVVTEQSEDGPRTFDISLPAHKFKGYVGSFLNAVVVDCDVRLCNDADEDCAARTCTAPPPPPVVDPEPEPNPGPVDPEPEPEPNPNPGPEPEDVRTRMNIRAPKASQPKARLASAVRKGKVTLVK